MSYDTATNLINDAASELGLGTSSDVYGSTDANFIQLRGFLKSGGRELVKKRDWTHLVKEYSFVTRPNWEASTAYTSAATAWTTSHAYVVGDYVSNSGNLYICTTAGTSHPDGNGPSGTTTFEESDNFPTPHTTTPPEWEFVNTGSANIVVNGGYYYTCTVSGTSTAADEPGPLNSSAGTETDNSVTWTWTGNASDYSLPSDFGNLIDQTGWNRTNALPVGGPLDGQMWQYLKGRSQGVVFNVFFRPTAGVMRLYPNIDTTGGQSITFEYQSTYWASATGGTTPTLDAPTTGTDIVYFEPLLVIRRIKLDWLKAKGFDTIHAQDQYDETLESSMNADGSAPVLNLRGRGPYDPLIGVQNVPITDFGS